MNEVHSTTRISLNQTFAHQMLNDMSLSTSVSLPVLSLRRVRVELHCEENNKAISPALYPRPSHLYFDSEDYGTLQKQFPH